MIEFTEGVKEKIKGLLDKNPGKSLRIEIEGTGCGGPYLKLSLDEANNSDLTMKVNGLSVLISEDVKKYAEATKINIFINDLGKDSE